MRQIFQKIIAGGPDRRTRLHTERGEMVPYGELRHIPRVTIQKASAILAGKRPDEPWWPLSIIPIIEEHLTSSSNVLEFGSGSSTIWLAKRTATVCSVEDNADWHRTVTKRISNLGLKNTTVRLAQGSSYYDLSHCSGSRFDLAVIDGCFRWKCIEAVLPLMAASGIIYLDNSDADKDRPFYPDPNMRQTAQNILESYDKEHPGSVLRRYSSLISGELQAGEGMVLRLSKPD